MRFVLTLNAVLWDVTPCSVAEGAEHWNSKCFQNFGKLLPTTPYPIPEIGILQAVLCLEVLVI